MKKNLLLFSLLFVLISISNLKSQYYNIFDFNSKNNLNEIDKSVNLKISSDDFHFKDMVTLANFSVNLKAEKNQICLGESTLVTVIFSGGTPPYTFAWDSVNVFTKINDSLYKAKPNYLSQSNDLYKVLI